MGCIYTRGDSGFLWIKYRDSSGRTRFESTKTKSRERAKNTLRLREGDSARGESVEPFLRKLKFSEAAADVETDYRVNGRKSLSHVTRRIKLHLSPHFGHRLMTSITTSEVRAFIDTRQKAGASNGEINRELAILKRAYTLAVQAGNVARRPYIPMLKEAVPRQGFFEADQLAAVLRHLPAPVAAVVRFAAETGWRVDSEVLPLEWRQVDFASGEVRLDAGTTKNGEGRVIRMTAALRALLEQQKAITDALKKERGRIVRHVFHRDGERIKSFRGSWKAACKAAGCPGKFKHDTRRTAVRAFVRAGIPEGVCMKMTGHKTRSVFERYNIVSGGDLDDAARKLDAVAGDSTRASQTPAEAAG
jgi:integrase